MRLLEMHFDGADNAVAWGWRYQRSLFLLRQFISQKPTIVTFTYFRRHTPISHYFLSTNAAYRAGANATPLTPAIIAFCTFEFIFDS